MRCEGYTGMWEHCPAIGTPTTELLFNAPAQTTAIQGALVVLIVAVIIIAGLLFVGTLD